MKDIDTTQHSPNLPKLSAQQHQKLLLLSLLPLSRSHATLTYKHLLSALDLPTTRALEELITTAIYSGLITATLGPANSLVSVTSISPLRDLAPGSLPALQKHAPIMVGAVRLCPLRSRGTGRKSEEGGGGQREAAA